mmetsp:Transcript_47846/g.109088  ORF Transcript_47846/g.109088 Transcript_47846/m.109088 type:complete len:174 (+) Transcript_47846:178-699(+)
MQLARARAFQGAEMIPGPIKRPDRAIQKIVRSYLRDAALVTDLVRCTVVLETLAQVQAFVESLMAVSLIGVSGSEESASSGSTKMFRLHRLKNRFDRGYDSRRSGGYRDLSLNVEVGWVVQNGSPKFIPLDSWNRRVSETHICEIQVHLRSVYDIKQSGSHDRYIAWRNLLAE